MNFKAFHEHALTRQLVRFGITGGLAGSVQFLSVILIVELFHLHPWSANIFGFMLGFVISFTGHRFWTFAGTKRHVMVSLPLFFMVAGINLLLNQSFLYLFLIKLHIAYPIALLMVLGIVACVTFLMGKLFVFPK